jgi:hypothetical protein
VTVPELHGSASAPSSEQPKVTPGWLALKVKVALVSLVLASGSRGGPVWIVVVAGPTTSHVYDAGSGSAFSAGSTARTRSVCMPGSRPDSSWVLLGAGPAQPENSGVPTESSAHSKLEPISLLSNLKSDGMSIPICAGGNSSIVVSGSVWSSTVHAHSVPTASMSRFGFTGMISRVWLPPVVPVAAASCSSVKVMPDSQKIGIAAPSSTHCVEASGSSTVNSNVAVVAVVSAAGPLVMVTVGGVMSPVSHS